MWQDCVKTVTIVHNQCFSMQFACTALAPDVQSLTRQACRQGTSRVLPGSFPPPSHWTGEGREAWPLWRWMDEEIKTSTGSIVPEHQKERWHGRGFDHEANTGGERGWSGGGHPCSWPHKKTVTHRCEDIQRKRVDMDILSTHNRTLMHEHALSHEEHAALFSLMPVCTWGKVTRSHSVLVAVLRCNVSPWMPL